MNFILTIFYALTTLLNPVPSLDKADLLDAAVTYKTLTEYMGRTPTISEVLYISANNDLDIESLNELVSLFLDYCSYDQCLPLSLIKFLATQEVWYGEPYILDTNHDLKALEFYIVIVEGKIANHYQQIDDLLTPPTLEIVIVEPEIILVEEETLDILDDDNPYFLNTEVDNIPLNTDDPRDLLDVERTYNVLTRLMGREPTIREILYMTIWSEYWVITNTRIGQEAIARSYYHFCGIDDCTQEELIKFLSGYQPWFGHLGYVDEHHLRNAERLFIFLTHEYNYNCCGEYLYEQVDEILDLEYADKKGWTLGKTWSGASQFSGPLGPPPANATFGYGANDFAIAAIKYPERLGKDHENDYYYFVTYEQGFSFSRTSLLP